jgi:hypothetical protein
MAAMMLSCPQINFVPFPPLFDIHGRPDIALAAIGIRDGVDAR